VFNRTVVSNMSVGIGTTGALPNAYAGVHAPDVAANLRVDQAWGIFQISGVAHEVVASYNFLNGLPVQAGAIGPAAGAPTALSEIGGHPDTKWGGAVTAALQIKNIPWGAGDTINVDTTYAVGDTKAVISTSAASPNFAIFGNTGRAGAYQSLGFGATTDAVFLPGLSSGPFSGTGGQGDLKLTKAWVSVVRTTTTGIPTGRPACSAAIRLSVTAAAPWHSVVRLTSPLPRACSASRSLAARVVI